MGGRERALFINLLRFASILIPFVAALFLISLLVVCSSIGDVCQEFIPTRTSYQLAIRQDVTRDQSILPFRSRVDICGANDSCVPKLSIQRTAMITSAELYQLTLCHIPKNMLTVSMAIICYLSEPARFEKGNKTVTTDMWSNRTCFQKNELRFPDEQKILDKRWVHLAIIRDPIEKFLSGWLEKCYYRTPYSVHWKPNQCYQCGRNLTCFVRRNYEKLLNSTNRAPAFAEEDHFWPQNWFCGFHRHRSRYKLLKYEHDKNASFFHSFFAVLRNRQVPDALVENIESQVLSSLTKHTTFNRPQTMAISQRLMSNKALLRLIVKTYFHDYDMFGFDMPCF